MLVIRTYLVVCGLLGTVCWPQLVGAQERTPPVSGSSATTRQMLTRFCVGCHNDRSRTAGLAFDTMDLDRVSGDAEVWERVLVKLHAQTMPPGGSPRPDDATYRAATSWLEREIDVVALSNPHPGRGGTFHRLNRAEYHSTIRDLLAIEVDIGSLLPADNTYEHGFDNNAELLSISPDLLSRYLGAARRISRLAVGIPPVGPSVTTYRVHPGMLQDNQQDEALSFGSRGGVAIRHYFPVDGEYTIKIRLQRNFSDYIIGFSALQELDVRLDGEPVRRFQVGNAEAVGQMAPLSFSGNIAGDSEWEFYMNTGDAGLEVRFPAKAGHRLVGVSFVRGLSEQEGELQPRNRGYGRFVDERYDENAAVEQVAIGGPYSVDGPGDTASRRAVFVCRPDVEEDRADSEACARRILTKLARKAYRRPVSATDINVLMEFYRAGIDGGNFDDGVQFALERMLVDPDFLFRIERDPEGIKPGSPYRLSDLELASRLSFFLWSSVPDEELLEVAVRGELSDRTELERQARRLLADERSGALIDNFVGQWLRLRNLDSQQRESAEYPEFDENLREAFRRETELFVESTIREDRSILDLLDANYTFVNERLARHYGISGVYGNRFRRVTFKSEDPRGGLLGHGGLLMVTSHPNRTSPVLRGKWLLETVLGAPPPEPPPNVPGLPDRSETGEPASVRDRLERHRANPVCSSCHAPMDPLGFALENFDAIGSWRGIGEAGQPIDASARMPSGETFKGPAGLRSVLMGRSEEFAGTVIDKLMSYALGRGLEYYDQPSVRQVTRKAALDGFSWSSLVVNIVESVPFQWRRSGGSGSTELP